MPMTTGDFPVYPHAVPYQSADGVALNSADHPGATEFTIDDVVGSAKSLAIAANNEQGADEAMKFAQAALTLTSVAIALIQIDRERVK